MSKLNKIKNVNLADLDADHTLENALSEDMADLAVDPTVPQVTEKIADPVGRNYEIISEITVKEIRDFLLGHAYHQITTYAILLMGIAYGVFMYFQYKNPIVPVAVIVFVLLFYPLILMGRAKKIKNTNKTFSETFHYMLDEKGCHLQLSHEAIDVEWKYFQKMMNVGSAVVVYTNKNNGYIIPVKDMGDKKEEIIAFLQEKIGRK
ncbi:MAG: hypothetical protein Q4E53_01515 [Eubacteriales bacterium]|nr:hypothetical protein [Eubacteriales bacterium]